MWHWLCKCLQPQTRCAVSAESPSLVSRGLEAPIPFHYQPLWWLWHCTLCMEVPETQQFLRIFKNFCSCKWKFKVKSEEDSCCLEPGTLSPTSPSAMGLVPCSAERMRNSLYPLLSWMFLIPTHKSTLSLYRGTIFLSFHPFQYGPINVLVLYFQPWLCNTDHSWLVWISPGLPRMLLKAHEEQKCFNQLNQSKKSRLDLKIYPVTFDTRCDDVFVLFL